MKKYVVVLLHLGYWLMYVLMILMLLSALNHGRLSMKDVLFSPAFVSAGIPGLIGFYAFYALLFDKYLARKKILNFIIAMAIIVILAAIVTEVMVYTIFHYRIDRSYNTILFVGIFLSFIALVNGGLGLVMKGFITWYGDIKVKLELNKKNYETELALMKAQINPHFLFNTINNIDVLILKDPPKASEYLNKLSDIMRFMLYETKSEKIALTTELSYIEKYIELQKIRTSNANYVTYKVLGDPGNISIEPMLYIPFIENAFKHAANKKVENAIKVFIAIENDKIVFECQNAYTTEEQIKPAHGGLGNEIIHKRLALLYPDKHSITVTREEGLYKVKFVLSL